MTLRMPAEWAPHDAVWIGFPHLAEEWSCAIDEGRRDVAAFANAVPDGGRDVALGDLVAKEAHEQNVARVATAQAAVAEAMSGREIGRASARERVVRYGENHGADAA